MFIRSANGNLRLDHLKFSILIDDLLQEAKPKNLDELQWIVEEMVETLQQSAQDYCDEDDTITEEWEPIY